MYICYCRCMHVVVLYLTETCATTAHALHSASVDSAVCVCVHGLPSPLPMPTFTPLLIHTVLRSQGQKYEHGAAPTRVMSHVVSPQYRSSTHIPTFGAPGGATRG